MPAARRRGVGMREWIEWYDSEHPIYVSARHRDVHFRRIAEDIRRFIPGPDATVLDYSCGEALHADLVAARVAGLILAEPATGVRSRLAARFAGTPNIDVCSLEELSNIPNGSVDLVVMHSVAQYMSPEELDAALRLIRVSAQAAGFIRAGRHHLAVDTGSSGCIGALAIWSGQRVFSRPRSSALCAHFFPTTGDYAARSAWPATIKRRSQPSSPLTGFAVERANRNIGHNQARTTEDVQVQRDSPIDVGLRQRLSATTAPWVRRAPKWTVHGNGAVTPSIASDFTLQAARR